MREKLRNDILSMLTDLDADTLKKVSLAIEQAVSRYELTPRVTDLICVENTIPRLCMNYLAARKVDGLSDCTLRQYYALLSRFFTDVHIDPENIKANDVRLWLYEHSEVSNRTLNLYLTILKTFFTWCAAEGYIPCDPLRTINRIKYQSNERKALTQDQLELIRSACKTDRETALIEFFYSTGCRVSEVADIKLSDINWQERTATVRHGKGNKQRTVYMNAKAIISAKRYLASRGFTSEYLFTCDRLPHGRIQSASIEKIIRGISKRSGIDFVPHQLRHTTATQMISSGAPVELVSRVLGHASINTTMIYAHIDDENVKREHMRCVI